MRSRSMLVVLPLLLLTACDDTKTPLSDPAQSKCDASLFGLWREKNNDGDVHYYHVGPAGEPLPAGVMRFVLVKQSDGTLPAPEEYLGFASVVSGQRYLNVVNDDDGQLTRRIKEKGWQPEAVGGYTLLRYRVEGDKLTVWLVDEAAKEKAIKQGKLKGTARATKPARFEDSTEKVAKFVSEAGDSLFNIAEPAYFERLAGWAKK